MSADHRSENLIFLVSQPRTGSALPPCVLLHRGR